jgi:hypothetical protein
MSFYLGGSPAMRCAIWFRMLLLVRRMLEELLRNTLGGLGGSFRSP